MKYVIVGTAGHVDHGKTTLIQKLTGVDTDRLTEEKKRGISIELGFAPFMLPSGRMAGVVDVPGHEKFIKHMLAGAGGMDLVLLVVAANEGVMPQTLEHLHILDLLQIEKGVIVVTKQDLVDEDWMMLVEEDIRHELKNTFLHDAPMIPVSAVTGEGLHRLKETIDEMTTQVRGKDTTSGFRLPVDRVFTMKGSGTVVTGTLVTGRLQAGAAAEILPSRQEVRVRQLQVHGKRMAEAVAGQRVAANLAGVEVEDLERGNVVAEPGLLHPTRALDIKLRLLGKPFGKETRKPLLNRARVRFHTGTQEILGRILLLDSDSLDPGQDAYAQIFLEEEAVVARGDHYIIRAYSPVTTIGGGTVIEPYARKHKRFRSEVIEQLMVKEQGTPKEQLEQHLLRDLEVLNFADDALKETGIHEPFYQEALQELTQEGKIISFQLDHKELLFHETALVQYSGWIQEHLSRFHQQQPLKVGVPLEELRAKLFRTMTPRIFSLLLQYFVKNNWVTVDGQKVRLPDFSIVFNSEQEEIRKALQEAWKENRFSPPATTEVAQVIRKPIAEVEKVAEAIVEKGDAVQLQSTGLIFSTEAWKQAVDLALDHFSSQESLTLSEFRDLLQASRKYALALLEEMDEKRITRRVGDRRVKGK